MSTKELLVFVEDRYCGMLREDGHGRHSFTYDFTGAVTPRLSLSMPLRTEPWTGKPIEAFIDGVLPDSPAMRRRVAALYDVNANNPFALLTAIGLDCAGGTQFVRPEDADTFRQSAILRPISETEIADRLRAISGDAGASWQIDDEHWSLNGAQDKIALCFARGQWHEALGSAATTHIIKPGIGGLREQAFNEYVCMKAIQELDIPVAASDFHLFGDLPAIVSTRWDREVSASPNGDLTVRRIHQEDMCQATAHMTAEKYQSDGGPSAIDIINCLRSNNLDEANVTLFYIALILNFLMAGTDAHAKNYAVLEPTGQRPHLAPLYDIASMFAYDTQRKQRKLAMSIGREYNYERIELRHWQRLAAATRSGDFDMLQLLLYRYATLLPEAFHKAGIRALSLSDDVLGSDAKTQRDREQLVRRIQSGIDAQCARVLRWLA